MNIYLWWIDLGWL